MLNAAAYHTGFNLGFNCAEAVNFAVPEWMPVGRDSVQCECGCLPDGVQLDMSIFYPDLYDSTSDEEEENGEESGNEEEEEQMQMRPVTRKRGRPVGSVAGAKRKAPAPVPASTAAAAGGTGKKRGRPPKIKPEPAWKKARRGLSVRIPRVPDLPELEQEITLPADATHIKWGPVADNYPMALVSKDPETKQIGFELVHRIYRKGSRLGGVWVGPLKEGSDGLFRPSGAARQQDMGWCYPKLVRVKTEWTPGVGRKRGGWKLSTKKERILM